MNVNYRLDPVQDKDSVVGPRMIASAGDRIGQLPPDGGEDVRPFLDPIAEVIISGRKELVG